MAKNSVGRGRPIPRRRGRSVVFALLAAGLLTLLSAGWIGAQDYSQDYGILGVGGAVCDTTDYGIVDTLTIQGATGEPAESADYQLVPATAVDSAPPSSVEQWMLY